MHKANGLPIIIFLRILSQIKLLVPVFRPVISIIFNSGGLATIIHRILIQIGIHLEYFEPDTEQDHLISYAESLKLFSNESMANVSDILCLMTEDEFVYVVGADEIESFKEHGT